MSKLDAATLSKLTDLCYIECTEEEKKQFLEQLNRNLSFLEQINELDTEGVLPCNRVLANLFNVMGEDSVGQTPISDLILNNAQGSHV